REPVADILSNGSRPMPTRPSEVNPESLPAARRKDINAVAGSAPRPAAGGNSLAAFRPLPGMSPHGNGPPRCACPRLPARVRWRQYAWQGNPAREESVMSQWQAVVLLALVAPALTASAEE